MTRRRPDSSIVWGDWDSLSGTHRFAHDAMATTFEVFIFHADPEYAAQAAWAAFDELDKLETELSRFIENSNISQINNLPANQPLQIGPAAFESLEICRHICAETGGAFDVTFGSSSQRRGEASLFELDRQQYTVQLLTDSVQIDLGGMGKGYAVDKMASLLMDWGIKAALIHGGSSSVLALDSPPGMKGWPVTLSRPYGQRETLARIELQRQALGASGLQKGSHIIDPHTAQPAVSKSAAWVGAADAATADALSTAFMVMTANEIDKYCSTHQGVWGMIVLQGRGDKTAKEEILRFALPG